MMEDFLVNFANLINSYALKCPKYFAAKLRPKYEKIANIIEIIVVDAPLTLLYCFTCIFLQFLNSTVLGDSIIKNYFGVPSWSIFVIFSPISYFRLFSHIFGHSSWNHVIGNVVHLLLVGPACEHTLGTLLLLKILLLTALSSGIMYVVHGPVYSIQLGASGVVFTLILLNSLLQVKSGTIPLTFICQAIMWCSKEIFLSSIGDGVLIGFFFHIGDHDDNSNSKHKSDCKSKSNSNDSSDSNLKKSE